MNLPLNRLFLDTNVFIIGAALPESAEADILRWIGYSQPEPGPVSVIISEELIEQILRVGRRLRGKDWGSQIIHHIWNDLRCIYVILTETDYIAPGDGMVPREDIGIYRTALDGAAECFVSSNHELIRVLAKQTGVFECLTPTDFVEKYLSEH
jgi:predicted nucleic acid-binding protein